MSKIRFRVGGLPVPEGNLSANRNGQLYHKNDKYLREWRYAIAKRARISMRHSEIPVHDGPVVVLVEFVVYRPKATPKRAVTPPAIKKPDLDKLERAVLDALTGHAYQDDSQVIALLGFERLAERDERMGAIIEVHFGDAKAYEHQRFRKFLGVALRRFVNENE